MKKSLVKLVALSATAMSLATVALPSVGAYYKDNNGVEYQTLVNVSQAQYDKLLPELSQKIADVRAALPAAETAVSTAESALKTAEEEYGKTSKAYEEAKAEYDAALAKLEAAKIEEANAKQALNELTASYGEYTKAVEALADTKQRAIDEAAQVRATEVAQAEAAAEPAVLAENDAQLAYDTAVQKLAEATADPNFPKDSLAELQAQELAAATALTEANNVLKQAIIDRDNAISAAISKEKKAVSAANAAYTTNFADLNRKYNTTDVYGMKAEIEKAQDRLAAATSGVTKATQAVQDAMTELTNADAANDAAKQVLTAAQMELANKKAELAKLFKDKAYFEANLHELVVGSKANSTDPSRINLNKEQQEIIKEITGKDSKELADALEKAKKELEELEKERDEKRNGTKPGETTTEGETTEGETTEGEATEKPEAGITVTIANKLYEGDTVVSGKTLPGATVTISVARAKEETASIFKTAMAAESVVVQADENGNYSGVLTTLHEGDTVTAVATKDGKTAETSTVVLGKKDAVVVDKDSKKEEKKSSAKLPETGEASSYAIFGAAVVSILAGLGLVAPKFSKED